jgi:hypothetical protein
MSGPPPSTSSHLLRLPSLQRLGEDPGNVMPTGIRRLSDKILVAFHHACDQGEIQTAGHLLSVLEFAMKRTPGRDRRAQDSLVAAHERLWPLRHPELSEW